MNILLRPGNKLKAPECTTSAPCYLTPKISLSSSNRACFLAAFVSRVPVFSKAWAMSASFRFSVRQQTLTSPHGYQALSPR